MNSSAFMENLRQLFAECDTDNNGSLGREEFGDLCIKIGLNREAANETFDRLDIDRNERITFDEFAAGFNQYKQTSSASAQPAPPPQVSVSSSSGGQESTVRGMANSLSRTSAKSPLTTRRQQKLSPSPVAARGRKSASPLGVMSLGSTGSSSNLTATGRSTTDASESEFNSVDIYNSTSTPDIRTGDSMVVYSSDAIPDYDQAGGSGQFGSLMSSNGSFSQLRNMQDLLDCVQKLQSENQILSQIFFKDKREREEYISQLGEEFDQQVREVEERANRRAKEELETEKRRLRDMMQAERETLQHHYQTIEKMSKLIKSPNGKLDDGDGIDKVRSQLEDTYLENRQLKRSLLDTKTDVAMIWKEMEKLKKQYEDKLSSAYERNNETRNECDHIKQQLNLMKDSNRKLQDASDVITTYITDKVDPVIKGAVSGIAEDDDSNNLLVDPASLRLGANSQSNSRRGSILSEYINGGNMSLSTDGGDNSINGDAESMSSDIQVTAKRGKNLTNNQKERLVSNDRLQVNNEQTRLLPKSVPRFAPIPQKFDGARKQKEESTSTRKLVLTSDEETIDKSSSLAQQRKVDAPPSQATVNQSQSKRKSITENHSPPVNDLKDQHESGDSPSIEVNKSIPQNKTTTLRNIGRHFFLGSRAQSEAKTDEKPCDIQQQQQPLSISTSVDVNDEPLVEPADGPSKATFNIILVGDSFVGKSSFAARFMEGSFVQGLISNCSIDFKTKTYKVDGINYTVNLWDTAGQERFRSITASYFRKADGIVLMYDVTDKRSYLNVRNWMSTISDTAAENVAVLLIGNKIDLRQKNNMEKCVPAEEGSRLAKEYEIVFLETSVKTGTNLVPSMGKLIKMIAKSMEPVEEDKDRIRLNDKSKIFNCMPKNC